MGANGNHSVWKFSDRNCVVVVKILHLIPTVTLEDLCLDFQLWSTKNGYQIVKFNFHVSRTPPTPSRPSLSRTKQTPQLKRDGGYFLSDPTVAYLATAPSLVPVNSASDVCAR